MSLIYYRYDDDVSEYLGRSIDISLTLLLFFFCHPVGSCNAADKHQSIVQERTGKMVKMYIQYRVLRKITINARRGPSVIISCHKDVQLVYKNNIRVYTM